MVKRNIIREWPSKPTPFTLNSHSHATTVGRRKGFDLDDWIVASSEKVPGLSSAAHAMMASALRKLVS